MRWLLLVSLFFLPACWSSGGHEVELKQIYLTVTKSQTINDQIPEGHIELYRATITGPDIVVPIVKEVNGDVKKLSLDAIPTGSDRTLLLEAINPFGQVIRQGLKEGISIAPGLMTHVQLVLNTVPIFINIKEGSAIQGQRLTFRILGEPNSEIIVGLYRDDVCATFQNQINKTYFIDTQSKDGVFYHEPALLDEGQQIFCVEDQTNGEKSFVTATVYQQTVRPGLSMGTGGQFVGGTGESVVRTTGQFLQQDLQKSNGVQTNFIEVVKHLREVE